MLEHSLGFAPRYAWVAATCLTYLATSAEISFVDTTGIEPASRLCESHILPLDDVPRLATHAGIEPEEHGRQPRRDTSHYMGQKLRRGDWIRTNNRAASETDVLPIELLPLEELQRELLGGPHGDSNPDLTRCKRGVFPLDDEPR